MQGIGQKARDETKFTHLYHTYRQVMFYTANSILKDAYLAEDAVHKAFLKIMDSLYKVDETDPNRTKAFLVIITRNTAITMYHEIKKQAVPFDEIEKFNESEESSPVDLVVSKEALAAIARCISQMDKKYADVISLKFYYQYDDQEIAQLLSITHENVRVRLHRAKSKLVTLLREEECLHGYQEAKR